MILLLAASGAEVAQNGGFIDGFRQLIAPFDLNIQALTLQIVNFVVVLFVLKKFAFGPVQEMLEKRRDRIAAGEEKLKRIEQQLAESEQRTQEAIDEANARAQRLIDEAKESAASLSEKKAQEAVASAQQILAKAEQAAQAERASMTAELKKEFGRLVTSTTAGVTGKVLSDDDRKRINEEALTSIDN